MSDKFTNNDIIDISLTTEYQNALKFCIADLQEYKFLPERLKNSKEFFLDFVSCLNKLDTDHEELEEFFKELVSQDIKESKEYCLAVLKRLGTEKVRKTSVTPLRYFSKTLYDDFDVLDCATDFNNQAIFLASGNLVGNIKLGTKVCLNRTWIYGRLSENWKRDGHLLDAIYQKDVFRFFDIVDEENDDIIKEHAFKIKAKVHGQDFYILQFKVAEQRQIDKEAYLMKEDATDETRQIWNKFYKLIFQHIVAHIALGNLRNITPETTIGKSLVKDEIYRKELFAIPKNVVKTKARKIGS